MKGIKRESLKQRFQTGRMPMEEDFSILIDSMVNMVDEGFAKTDRDGLRIDQIAEGRLVSFYENLAVNSPQWFLQMGASEGGERPLHLAPRWSDAETGALTLARKPTLAGPPRLAVGVNNRAPRHELDVVGTVSAHGRRGRDGSMRALADGNWHAVTEPLRGCHALEIVAGTGATSDAEGKYSLVHAIAVKAFGGRGRITTTQSNFGSGCSRLQLRWHHPNPDDPDAYVLQVRTHCGYESGGAIRYHVAELWSDPLMVGSEGGT